MITSSFLPSERYVCRIGLLERLALHTPYPAIAARISDIVRRLPRGRTTVIVDRTGAHAAYDMLVEKGLSPIGLTISGGDSVHWDGRYVTVPKMRLLTGLLSICYRGELEISERLRDYVEFRRQLQNIGTTATDSGTGETWRARRGHDDLVIALNGPTWPPVKGSSARVSPNRLRYGCPTTIFWDLSNRHRHGRGASAREILVMMAIRLRA